MNDTSPTAIYKGRISSLTAERTELIKQKSLVSWSRLAAIVVAILAFYFLRNDYLAVAIVVAVLCVAVFFRLVVVAINTGKKIDNLNRLIAINEQELQTAAGQFFDLPDGASFLPHLHPYANDLDIFGRASLYQYINRTGSGQGSTRLADWLLHPAETSIITARQEAAKELRDQYQWRQQLQANGNAEPITIATQQKIKTWLENEDGFFTSAAWQAVRFIGPAIMITLTILFIGDIVPTRWFNLSLLLFFIITGWISKKATNTYNTLSKIAPEISTLSSSIGHIEQQEFTASWLVQNRQRFTDGTHKASISVKTLNGILSRLDIRLNPIAFIPLNILLFWDLQQMLAFEKWKQANKKKIMDWFEALGQMEAMNSIATLAFNHAGWCFPEMVAGHGTFAATALGHPLIAEHKRVDSSFATEGIGKIGIITGSNMAGKSTFLRSIGLSLVMGMAGMPVCAVAARFSHMAVISTMRISDNLEESTSTFYAELKKLKEIIDAVNRKEKIFLLLDEILRGTNSLDRHTGSKALIQQFIKQDACGIIATHDLELAKLVDMYPANIHNYHFDVQVANEELYFDYKLKEGVCQSLNASILMKKIGIEM
ncbi:MAG: hypothetical protein ABIX01_00950 [Chitinophagaceae bacterium]